MTYEGPEAANRVVPRERARDGVRPARDGKTLKPKTILARSSEGNVRVADVIHAYASGGREKVRDGLDQSPNGVSDRGLRRLLITYRASTEARAGPLQPAGAQASGQRRPQAGVRT